MSKLILRRQFWIVAALTLLSSSIANNTVLADDETIELKPRWKKGDKALFEMVKTKKKIQDGKTTLTGTARVDLEIEVLSVDKNGALLAWTWGEMKFDDPQLNENALAKKILNLSKGLRIMLEFDTNYDFGGIQNWKELKETAEKQIDTLMNELKTASRDPPMIDKLKMQLTSMYKTKEQVTEVFVREARPFFSVVPVLGVGLSGNKPLEYKDQLPNPFGGEPLPCRGRFTLKNVDGKSKLVTVTWKQTMDTEGRVVFENTMKDVAKRMGLPVPDAELIKTLTMEDSAEFVVDLSTGWNRSFTFTRLAKINQEQGTQIETITIRKK